MKKNKDKGGGIESGNLGKLLRGKTRESESKMKNSGEGGEQKREKQRRKMQKGGDGE